MRKLIRGLLVSFILATSTAAGATPKAEVLVLLSGETALPLKDGQASRFPALTEVERAATTKADTSPFIRLS
ncbi:hypothetical protein CAI21_14890 [Alkalilimnicola ehrlichii]|uniref:Uncharacterized protein n=1 Tax=Alkalilimnicola ehrlichii TaxID=351052 RepID=A0A3E0WR04_9GAMM|nr:hypothetical protein [Alkalilimnicola ehrlichii]RFA27319.1 hypothetical protein CAI21_14890 [Alkalilimnicola ehrlichii]RFA34427.1 hypothetical protein CAL65_15460 [Alkalilimnicola ehrlichii]